MQGHLDFSVLTLTWFILCTGPQESAHWVLSFRTLWSHSQQFEWVQLKNGIHLGNIQFEICITTYEGSLNPFTWHLDAKSWWVCPVTAAFFAEDGWFKTCRWTYCVFDEGHNIKNAKTNLAHRVQGIGAIYGMSRFLDLWPYVCILADHHAHFSPHCHTGPKQSS